MTTCSRCGWDLLDTSAHRIERNRYSGKLMAECFLCPKDGAAGAQETWLAERNFSPDILEPEGVYQAALIWTGAPS